MSDQEILYRLFDQVEEVMLDGKLTAEQRHFQLHGLLGFLSDAMGDPTSAYQLWQKLMQAIAARVGTRH